ncbi:hypothetical protein BCAR13_30001 [Paraburkholderia caribensis]|nr:hypothetical protein BCAR13_30001 [Paraburkholderia caribensis]
MVGDAVWGFRPLRWHPRFAFVGRASTVGVFGLCAGIRDLPSWVVLRQSVFSAFALASANC